jgi:hypothetical protein
MEIDSVELGIFGHLNGVDMVEVWLMVVKASRRHPMSICRYARSEAFDVCC